MKLISILKSEGYQVSLQDLLSHPTLSGLASVVVKVTQVTVETKLVTQPEKKYEPFPLNDIQFAYWIGRKDTFELGNISTHEYYEFVGNLKIEQLAEAFNKCIARHDMLKVIVTDDGMQQILPTVPKYTIQVIQDKKTLQRTREELSHQVFETKTWPLFDIRATHIEKDLYHIHFSIDLLIADAKSLMTLFQDWGYYYENPNASLPDISLSFRDYLLSTTTTEVDKASKDYWMSKINTLPIAPQLPLVTTLNSIAKPHFSRCAFRLEVLPWNKLKAISFQYGVTPSTVLCCAFIETLRLWSSNTDFTVNVLQYNRQEISSDISQLIGDFTSQLLLSNEGLEYFSSFKERVQALQRRVFQDLDHRQFSGVQVLREQAKIPGNAFRALMPVVFTSMIGQFDYSTVSYIALSVILM